MEKEKKKEEENEKENEKEKGLFGPHNRRYWEFEAERAIIRKGKIFLFIRVSCALRCNSN